MVTPTVIGASVGAVLGGVLIAVIVTCIVYVSRRLKRRTNTRSKFITSSGDVFKQKWAEDERNANKGYYGDANNRMLFGNIDKTEHVEVKEKRRREEIIIPPAPQKVYRPPSPVYRPPPRARTPPPRPRTPPPRARTPPPRPRRPRDSPPMKRRASIGPAEGAKYFIYGVPMPMTRQGYNPWGAPVYPGPMPAIPPPALPAPLPALPAPPPAPQQPTFIIPSPVTQESQDIEEQERVMVIEDWMTEKTFNPRWTGGAAGPVSATVPGYDIMSESTSATIPGYNITSEWTSADANTTQYVIQNENAGPIPLIVTKLV